MKSWWFFLSFFNSELSRVFSIFHISCFWLLFWIFDAKLTEYWRIISAANSTRPRVLSVSALHYPHCRWKSKQRKIDLWKMWKFKSFKSFNSPKFEVCCWNCRKLLLLQNGMVIEWTMDNRSKQHGESVDLDQNRGLNLCLHLKNLLKIKMFKIKRSVIKKIKHYCW